LPARALVLGSHLDLSYRVLRCAAPLFERVHVAMEGPRDNVRKLAASRHCASFTYLGRDGFSSPAAVDVINAICAREGIGVVIPAGVSAVDLLIRRGRELATPHYPVPNAQAFDDLATKWKFAEFCRKHAIDHPRTQVFANKAELEAAPPAKLPDAFMLKPVDRDSAWGVIKSSRERLAADLRRVGYAPILVQEFVPGEDIGGIAFAEAGVVKAAKTLRYGRRRFCKIPYRDSMELFDHEQFGAALQTLVQGSGFTGALNIDGRRRPDGSITVLECNPRFWYSLDWAMLAGVNYVALGLSHIFSDLPATTDFERLVIKGWPGVLFEQVAGRGRQHPYLSYLLDDPRFLWGVEIPRMTRALLRRGEGRLPRMMSPRLLRAPNEKGEDAALAPLLASDLLLRGVLNTRGRDWRD
jgi:hypothetical protein